MLTETIMLKWIKKRTRILSAIPSCQASCNGGKQQLCELTNSIIFWARNTTEEVLNNHVCPLCRRPTVNNSGKDNSCCCGETELDDSESIDYDTIKRQTERVNSIQIRNNLREVKTSTKALTAPKYLSVCRSRSDVTYSRSTQLSTRLSPRSRIPIINPAEFAEFSSGNESIGNGESTGTSQSDYSSEDSLRKLLNKLVIKPDNGQLDSPSTYCSSPVPKMGCRAMIQRSASVHGPTDTTRNIAFRSQSLNRTVRPSCGVKRSKSRANSFRKVNVFNIKPKIDNCEHVPNHDQNIGYLGDHINQLSDIRIDLQNLYSLDKIVIK